MRASVALVCLSLVVLPGANQNDTLAERPRAAMHARAAAPPAPGPSELRSDLEPHSDVVREFDIVATGDILIHTALWESALAAGGGDRYDFRPMFRDVRPILRKAGLAICHLETPLGTGPPASYPVFNTPTDLADAIRWAGWDACSTASNHSVDRGQDGVDATVAALDRAGVRHTGSYWSKKDARRILMLESQGVRVAFLAYTSWTNGIPSPHPWTVNLISMPKIEEDARRARSQGADLVVANFHWGNEYVHDPNSQQASVAHELLQRHIVDLVIGQHVHVVQPIERIAGRFVVYGEGNLVSGMPRSESRDGLMAVIHVRALGHEVRITGVDYIPTWVAHPGYVIEPVVSRLDALVADERGHGYLAAELEDSYRRTVEVVGTSRWTRPVESVGRDPRGAEDPGVSPGAAIIVG
jgi:poly-gamma-glutamate capsule biosynthesis protein CapA/YwtB (metallophosphatase superfamily)